MKANWQVGAEPPGGAESCLPYLVEEPGRSQGTAVETRLKGPGRSGDRQGAAQARSGLGGGGIEMGGGWGMVSARAFEPASRPAFSCTRQRAQGEARERSDRGPLVGSWSRARQR
jgi:hypothetical protein